MWCTDCCIFERFEKQSTFKSFGEIPKDYSWSQSFKSNHTQMDPGYEPQLSHPNCLMVQCEVSSDNLPAFECPTLPKVPIPALMTMLSPATCSDFNWTQVNRHGRAQKKTRAA
ncbi:hypothetical protein ILYODFUR_014948 [Ilyodon furcidens]|uniref:Uncharacterized protein n=1 Tax=Ilyodon furcidens TaxID=33524 RepID=A0ABV0VE25_9TELE